MTGPLVPVILWPGSGSAVSGSTPFGIYDDDVTFQRDAPNVAKWVCNSLGYPMFSIELTDITIYTHFEESIREYSSIINEFNMREHMLNLQGTSTSGSVTQKLIHGSPLPIVIEMASYYGSEAGSGGKLPYRKGSIQLQSNVQDYDLQTLFADVSESGNRIEIRRIWHQRTPALQRFFDPFAGGVGGGIGVENTLREFGWGSYSVASQYLLMPLYETLLRAQAIEFNDIIRRSQYSFEIKNNVLRLMPIPDESSDSMVLWFEYTVLQDKLNLGIGNPGSSVASSSVANSVVSDYSNVPYTDIVYSNINDVGKRWIRKYTLACSKETLGLIRSKYASMPIPNSEINLDGLTLRQEAMQEKELLLTQLRETLERTGRRYQLESAKENETNVGDILRNIPTGIYIG